MELVRFEYTINDELVEKAKIPFEEIARRFVRDFFNEIPFEKVQKFINFKHIVATEETLKKALDDSNTELVRQLQEMRHRKISKIEASLIIHGGAENSLELFKILIQQLKKDNISYTKILNKLDEFYLKDESGN